MNTIYKYEIPPFEKFELEMPEDTQILDFKTQNNKPVLWAAVQLDKPMIKRYFVTYATGADIPDYEFASGIYLGSVLFSNDTLVTHLLELPGPNETA